MKKQRAILVAGLGFALVACLVYFLKGRGSYSPQSNENRESEIKKLMSSAASSGELYHISDKEINLVLAQADEGDERAILRLFGAVNCPAPNKDPRITEVLERALERGSGSAKTWDEWRKRAPRAAETTNRSVQNFRLI